MWSEWVLMVRLGLIEHGGFGRLNEPFLGRWSIVRAKLFYGEGSLDSLQREKHSFVDTLDVESCRLSRVDSSWSSYSRSWVCLEIRMSSAADLVLLLTVANPRGSKPCYRSPDP